MNYKEAMKTLKGFLKKTTVKSIIDLTDPLKDEYKTTKYFYKGDDFILISNGYVDETYNYRDSPYIAKLNKVINSCEFLFRTTK